MKKVLKWLFFSPALFFGFWLIGLFCESFREALINTTTRILKVLERELERSL
jgi:hypothetical protein